MIAESDIRWSEHPDQRFPGRVVLVGSYGTKAHLASFRERREVAVEAIMAAFRNSGDEP